MSDINVQGVTSLNAPGVYVELDFGDGISGAPTQSYNALILGNMTSQGSAFAGFVPGQVFGPGTLVPLQTSQNANDLFGPGSGPALMFAAFRSRNKTSPLSVAPVAPATGTAASQAITVTAAGGSNQTTGVIQYQVDGKNPAQAVFSSTDTATTIASNLAAAINSNISLPVIATSSAAVLTVTAKVVGGRGNDLRGFGSVISGSGVTVSINSPSFFTSGAGSDASGYTATLNALSMNNQRYYYVVPEAGADFVDGYTNGICAEIKSYIDTQAQAGVGLRQRAVFGSNDTVAHTCAVATTLNDPRLEVLQCYKLDLTPGELAATFTGALMIKETNPLGANGVNFDGFGANAVSAALWQVPGPLDGSAPSASDIQTCLISGVSPLRVGPGNTTSVVKRITTKFFDLGGTGGSQQVLDLRITDAGKVTVCDRFFDDLSALISLRYPEMLIGNDPPAGSSPAAPGIVTESKIKIACLDVIQTYAAAGLINGPATIAGLQVQRNTINSSSIGVIVPLFVSDPLHQVLILGLQNPAIFV